jgi:hypothetical protein
MSTAVPIKDHNAWIEPDPKGNASQAWTAISSSEKKALADAFGIDPAQYYTASCKHGSGNPMYYTDSKDPDAPMVLRFNNAAEAMNAGLTGVQTPQGYFVKGPSRAEYVLQQYAVTQAGFKAANISSIALSRRCGSYSHKPMAAEAAQRSGLGAHISTRSVVGYSTLHDVSNTGFGHFIFQNHAMPTHQMFVHHDQHLNGMKFFQGYESEHEVLVIGHDAVTQESFPAHYSGTDTYVKVARGTAQLLAAPIADPTIPKGFGRYVMNPDDVCYWVTNKEVRAIIPIYQRPNDAANKSAASFEFSVAEAHGSTVTQ